LIHVNPNSKQIKYALLLIIPFLVLSCLVFLSNKLNKDISASTYTDITTQITVGNSAPSFTSGPAENTASTSTAPTSIGATVQFNATATDANGESYYLIVCSTNSVTAGSGGSYPSCGGTLYCRNTTAVSSGSSTSCSYTTIAGNAWSNAWYAFVCDNNSTAATCSSYSQGSGDSGSPFFVNHPPVFTVIGSNTPQNPGSNLTWTTTASDPDTGSTVELLVCKTNAMSSGACTGGNWCTSTAVASNPTCSYSIPTPTADGSYDAWVFVVDQFNLGASGTGTKQGSESDFTVNNVAPVVSSVTLNGGSAITLTESTTTAVSMTASVTDNNGCRNLGNTADEISSVKGYLYRSGITYTGCDTAGEANGNNCYPELTCSAGTCTNGVTTYSCSADVQYYADPTDLSYLLCNYSLCNYPDLDLYLAFSFNYFLENWLTTFNAIDNNSTSGNATLGTGVELNSLIGFTTQSLIDYGSLSAGGSNDPLNKTTVITPTGNAPFNVNISGTKLCTDYSTCSTSGKTPLDIAQQKYSLITGTSYASSTALSATPTKALIGVPKINNGTVTTKTIWWGVSIPIGTVSGIYNGLNTITVIGEGVISYGGLCEKC